jgi:hypothetical protein
VCFTILFLVAVSLAVALYLFGSGGPLNVMRDNAAAQTAHEMGQLEVAVERFRTNMGPRYIPSRIKLCEKYGNYHVSDVLDQDSVSYLTALFPQLLSPDPVTGVVHWATVGIDWNGDGKIGDDSIILEGHQCLVFFLGGIPTGGNIGNRSGPPGCMGFSKDPRDPAKIVQTSGRERPFFEFPTHRLIDLSGKGFYSFADPYQTGKPYAYFSTHGIPNGYARYTDARSQILDNRTLGVQPYHEAPGQYYNPMSFQIISAGGDGIFGPGGLWTRANADSIAVQGRDDQTNFYLRGLMGRVD